MEYRYTGKTEADLWKYLDDIEKLDLDTAGDVDTDVTEVTDEITKTSSGRNALVERYGGSHSIYIVHYVWGAILIFTHDDDKARSLDAQMLDEICRLTFVMAEKIRWLTVNPDTLMGVFNAITTQVWHGFWNERKFPPTLFAMLERCLRFGWMNEGKAQHMQIEVLTLLNMMCEKNIIGSNFDEVQIKWLRNEAHRLATLNLEKNSLIEGLEKEGFRFLKCLDECN